MHKFKNKLAQFDTKVKYRSNCNESALSKRVADSIYQMQVSRAEIGWLHDNTAYSHVSCCIHYCNLVAGMSKILVWSGDKLNYICFEHSLPPAYNSNRVNVFFQKMLDTSPHVPSHSGVPAICFRTPFVHSLFVLTLTHHTLYIQY